MSGPTGAPTEEREEGERFGEGRFDDLLCDVCVQQIV